MCITLECTTAKYLVVIYKWEVQCDTLAAMNYFWVTVFESSNLPQLL